MKIRLRYDNLYQEVEITRDEASKWLSIQITSEMSDAEAERLANTEVEKEYNRFEYNNYRKHLRHLDSDARPNRLDGKPGKAVTEDDAVSALDRMDLFADNRCNEQRDQHLSDEEWENAIRSKMRPDQAELLIAICLYGTPKSNYAAQIGVSPSALSHRFETAKKNFIKIFGKPQF